MKKKILISASLLIILCNFAVSCVKLPTEKPSGTEDSGRSTDSSSIGQIELEAQILAIMQNQQLSDKERKAELDALKAELDRLKGEAVNVSKDTSASKTFTYTVENGKAVITHIDFDGEDLTLPSVIDGYSVYAIGSEVLLSNNIKNITVTQGIEKIDWFAFKNCISLTSISIPDSVSSIGYGAFDNTAKAFTIMCNRDSFAHKYAQSYGLTYDISR